MSEAAFAEFARRLAAARADLERAARLDPRDPTPAAHLVKIARGLGDQPGAQRGFEDAVARDPGCRHAHLERLISLTPRWGGSDEALFAFAREAARTAPEGSFHPVLIAAAHIEVALFSGSEASRNDEIEAYFADDDVRAEVVDAYRRSLGSKHYRPDRLTLLDQNIFAFALSYAGEWALAAVLFDAIGGRRTDHPWGCFGNPAHRFQQRERTRGPARVELSLLAPGVLLLAFGGWLAQDGREASRRLQAADTTRPREMVVQATTAGLGQTTAEGEVEGGIHRVRVGNGRKAPRPGARIAVYPTTLPEPRYVSAAELEAARPAPVLLGQPRSWKLLVAIPLLLVGLALSALSFGGRRLFTS